MRIHRMYLNGFGIHRERTFELDLNAQATIFYGRNEAGKSTIMGFVRSMLFGFPKRNNMVERYEPLHGGVHGGALTLLDGMGREIRLERYEKNGSLKLLFPDGTEGGDAALQSLIGGLTADLYRNLFAFSLSELQRLDTLQAEEISGFLFSAGMGISGGAIAQAERKLSQQMEQLYKPRGSKQSINEQLHIIEQSEAELRRSKENSGRYNEWQAELSRLDENIAADELELSRMRSEWDWYNKCSQARESWIGLLEVDRELQDLPEWEAFPEHAVNHLEKLLEERDRANLQLLDIEHRRTNVVLQLEEIRVNEGLIECKAELEQLLEAAAAYSDSKNRTADGLAEMDSYRAQLNRYLRQISSDWSEAQLQQFPLSIHHREQVNDYAERFGDNVNRRQSRVHERERLEEQIEHARLVKRERQLKLDELTQRMDQRFSLLQGMDREALESHNRTINKRWDNTKKHASDLIHIQQRLTDARRNEQLLQAGSNPGSTEQYILESKSGRRFIKIIAAVMNILLPLWISFGLNSITSGISIFILLASFNVYLWLLKDNPAVQSGMIDKLQRETTAHRESLEKEVRQMERQWVELCEQLYTQLSLLSGIDQAAAGRSSGHGDANVQESLRYMEPLIESLQEDMHLYQQADLELHQANEQLRAAMQTQDELSKQLAVHVEYLQKLQQEEALLQQEWRLWLEKYMLPIDLSPESMKIMFQYAEQGLQVVDYMTKVNNKLAHLEEVQIGFEQSVIGFLHQQGVKIPLTAANMIYELKKLKETLEAQIRMKDQYHLLEQQAEELESSKQQSLDTLARVQNKLQDLLTAAKATDEDELRSRARLYERRLELERMKRHLQVVIFTWVKEENQHKLFETLEQSDADQLEKHLSAMEEAINQLELRLNDSKDRRGGLRKEMDNLQSGGQHAVLLQRHQEEITELQLLASKWAELALSAELLRRAKEIYERERQPGVLLRASQYMRSITEGRFVRVVSRLGEKSIFLEREGGEQVDSSFLSRGTAEQLYLAMRFALADEYSKTVALPLIMDDIFVNFDHDRLTRTLQLLSDVAERHQIILFTCHEHVTQALQSALPRLQIIDLHS
jgi:uncharacterized protein YhaN